jgi:hypothetical protein
LGGLPAVAGKVVPSSFAGTWNVMMDAKDALVFEIHQESSGRVTGSYYSVFDREGHLIPSEERKRFALTDAYVRDKTLSFKVVMNGPAGVRVSLPGTFVLNEDGKTFKGTYADKAVTGVLQGS